MKRSIQLIIVVFVILRIAGCTLQKTYRYIIRKENGRIILAYKAFEDFLDTDRSWGNYQKLVLDKYPEMRYLHERSAQWGSIDSVKFPQQLKDYDKADLEHYFTQYDEKFLNDLYDLITGRANRVLAPVNDKPLDLCLFLPYSGCFINLEGGANTIYISLYIDPKDVKN